MNGKLGRSLAGLFALAVFACVGMARGQSASSGSRADSFPGFFVGTFSDLVPSLVGGTVPDTKFTLTCNPSGACVVRIGKDVAGDFSRFSQVGNLQKATAALSYAKKHKDVPATSHLAWQAKNLMPLLDSGAAIETCVDLKDQSLPDGYMLACKLDRDPAANNKCSPSAAA